MFLLAMATLSPTILSSEDNSWWTQRQLVCHSHLPLTKQVHSEKVINLTKSFITSHITAALTMKDTRQKLQQELFQFKALQLLTLARSMVGFVQFNVWHKTLSWLLLWGQSPLTLSGRQTQMGHWPQSNTSQMVLLTSLLNGRNKTNQYESKQMQTEEYKYCKCV